MGVTPPSMFINVVFPAPFSPSSAWISPLFTEKSTFLSTDTPPYFFTMPLICSASSAIQITSLYGVPFHQEGAHYNFAVRRLQSSV